MNSGIFTIPPSTIMEIYQNLPEGTRADLLEYIIYLLPEPGPAHEQVLESIYENVLNAKEGSAYANVMAWPCTFFLDETSHAIRPDIAVTLKSNPGKIVSDMHFRGVPDFVVEVLSPVNKRHDIIKKKSAYQRFGVKEYWTVDPESKAAQHYALRAGQLQLQAEHNGCIKSQLLPLEFQF
ncbi:MAG: Uma2 family endonuclease [Chryseolinea sp.]